jgi:arylsulfatase A-like enzyme
MIEHDLTVGKFLDLLDGLGIADKTIVFYSTDNGPHMNTWPDAAMTPFWSEKNTNWEGGWRVPAMVRWPVKIKAGTVTNEVVRHMDWFPTFVAAAGDPNVKQELLEGVTVPELGGKYKVRLDGYNFFPLLTGETEKSPRREMFYFTDDGDLSALRYGDWKMMFLEQERWATFRTWIQPFTELRVPLIFNLRRHPYERSYRTSNTYYDWLLDHAFMLVPAQQYVANFLATFKEFPPRQKAASGWYWTLLSGIVSILLGGMIVLQWPVSGLWMIGLFVAIELIFNGWSYVFVALAARKAGRTERAAT